LIIATHPTTAIRKIGRNLELIQLYSTQLQQQQVSLNDSVTRSRVNMLDALPADPVCVNSVACARMRATINGLAVEADFRQVGRQAARPRCV